MGGTEDGNCKYIPPRNQVHELEHQANVRGLVQDRSFAKSVTKFRLVMRHQILRSCGVFGSGMMAAVVTKSDRVNCLEMSL